MSKLKMHSPDLIAANIDKLAALFPNCVTESADDKGQLRRAVDFDLLRQELSGAVVDGPVERYTLNWPGKREAIVAANTPVKKTLRPCEAESVDFDTTKNLYIEGDNLEVLKLLQETYLGRVKMIFIDPPYNTGNDFIYDDDFTEDVEADLLKSSQKDESGGRLVANPESNGRFHSDWLTMMYPRIRLARDMLCNNGIICVAIDDNEAHNLRKILDELFGTDNFVATVVWKHTQQSKNDERHFSRHFNYIIIYTKSKNDLEDFHFKRTDEDNVNYHNPDNDPKGEWRSGDVRSPNFRKTLCYPIETPIGTFIEPPENGWRWSKETLLSKMSTGEIIFKKDNSGIIRKIYLSDQNGRTPENIWDGELFGSTRSATTVIKNLFDGRQVFDTPKPTELVKSICTLVAAKDSITLDFFSGSATTAHAVMQLNAEDGGTRRFIMVQLPEVCDEKSEAFKAGYKTICDIGKERIRRAGQKIKEANATNAPNLDVGFRVFKVDSSNMKDVYYTPDATEQSKLDLFADAIKEDRTAEDLLFQVFLECGLDLALPIAKETVEGRTVFVVDQNVLVACFAADIPESLIRELAKRKPLKAVFLDRSFAKDSTKLNVTQIFKQLSPGTEVMTL